MSKSHIHFIPVFVLLIDLFMSACTPLLPEIERAVVELPTSYFSTRTNFPTPPPKNTPIISPSITPPEAIIEAQILPTKLQPITRGKLEDLAPSPDGEMLAVACASGVYLHDATTLAYVRPLIQDQWVSSVAYSNDGKQLAIGGYRWAALLDIESGQEIARLSDLGDWIQVAFGQDSHTLLVLENAGFGIGASSTALYTWDLKSGDTTFLNFETHGSITSMTTDRVRALIALGTDTGRIELFSWQNGKRLSILAEAYGPAVTDLAFSQDGDLLTATFSSADGLVKVWEVGRRNRLIEEWRSGWNSLEPYVSFSHDGKRLFSGMGDIAQVWERETKAKLGMLQGYSSDLIDLVISPDGSHIAWASHAGLAFVRPLNNEGDTSVFTVPYEHTLNVAFSVDGHSLFAGQYSYAPDGSTETVRQWDIETGTELMNYPNASAVALHPGPGYLSDPKPVLALADQEGNGRLVDLTSGGEFARWEFPNKLAVMQLKFSSDGLLLGAWGVADAWFSYAVQELSKNTLYAFYPGGVRGAFSPSGMLFGVPLVELNDDHTGPVRNSLLLTTLDGGKSERRIDIPGEGSASFSPDGCLLAVGMWQSEASLPGGYPPENYDPQANGVLIFDTTNWEQLLFLSLPYGTSRLDYADRANMLVIGGPSGEIFLYQSY